MRRNLYTHYISCMPCSETCVVPMGLHSQLYNDANFEFFDQPVFVLLAVIFLPPTCLNEIQWLNECSLYGQWCWGLLNDMDISVVWWFWIRSRDCLTSTENQPPNVQWPYCMNGELRRILMGRFSACQNWRIGLTACDQLLCRYGRAQ